MPIPFAQSSFPQMYERELVGPLFQPWAELMLDLVELMPGDRVLDLACGTGIVARLARQRLGDGALVVGVDLSPPMLELARGQAPEIDWRVGDAGALPLAEGEQFDVVLCQQGLQFFPDKSAAARQMRRALAEGGRLAVSTWRPDEGMPVLRELRGIAERHLGPITDRRHAFGEPAAVETLLREAGFADVRARTLARTIRFSDGAAFAQLNALALVGMSPRAAEIGEDERARVIEAIVRDSVRRVREGSDATGLSYEIEAVVATARA